MSLYTLLLLLLLWLLILVRTFVVFYNLSKQPGYANTAVPELREYDLSQPLAISTDLRRRASRLSNASLLCWILCMFCVALLVADPQPRLALAGAGAATLAAYCSVKSRRLHDVLSVFERTQG